MKWFRWLGPRWRELSQAERQLQSLRETTRLKDEFLGQVSHELRTPLTIVHGYAELISQGQLVEPEAVRATAHEIHASSMLMLRLVDDLLDTSRLATGRVGLRPESTDLARWLARTTAAFAQATPTHRVEARVPDLLPRVRVDLDRLGQVLHNLLSNAARYSAEGTLILVTAHVFEVGRLEIQVIDEGIGIPPGDRERIFERFYRGRQGVKLAARGAGLGLAVARALVEAHGGEIGVRSTPGRGSTFWVRLPTEVADVPAEPPVWIDPAALAA